MTVHVPLTRAEQRAVVKIVEGESPELAARLDADLDADPVVSELRLLRESNEAGDRETRTTLAKELRANRLSITAIVVIGMALNAALNGVALYWSKDGDVSVGPDGDGSAAAWFDTDWRPSQPRPAP